MTSGPAAGQAPELLRVTVNGEPRSVPQGTTVEELVASVTSLASGVAAAVNGTVLARGAWGKTAARDGDRIEVVTAVQGG